MKTYCDLCDSIRECEKDDGVLWTCKECEIKYPKPKDDDES